MEIPQLLCDKVFDVPEVRLVRVPQMHLVVFPEVLTVVGMPVVCNARCRGDCGLSAVAVHRHGVELKGVFLGGAVCTGKRPGDHVHRDLAIHN